MKEELDGCALLLIKSEPAPKIHDVVLEHSATVELVPIKKLLYKYQHSYDGLRDQLGGQTTCAKCIRDCTF